MARALTVLCLAALVTTPSAISFVDPDDGVEGGCSPCCASGGACQGVSDCAEITGGGAIDVDLYCDATLNPGPDLDPFAGCARRRHLNFGSGIPPGPGDLTCNPAGAEPDGCCRSCSNGDPPSGACPESLTVTP